MTSITVLVLAAGGLLAAGLIAGICIARAMRVVDRTCELDFSAAAPRGELDLSWDDPRHSVEIARLRGTGESERDVDAKTSRYAASSRSVEVTTPPDGDCEAVTLPLDVARDARVVEVVASENVTVTNVSATGLTPERTRLGLAPPSNVIPIDGGDRRA